MEFGNSFGIGPVWFGLVRVRTLGSAAIFLALLSPVQAWAHGEIAGGGQQTFTHHLEGKNGKYRIELMHSPSLPTAGEPANIVLKLMRLLPEPDPLLGSEVPVNLPPEGALLFADTQKILVPHLPVHPEGETGVFGIAEYRFPQGGSFLLRFVIHTETGDELSTDFPVTVQANAGAFFRLWMNLAVSILILGLTGMQLWKVRARGGQLPQMVRPALTGLVCLVVVVLAMDRFILGAVLDLRKPKVASAAATAVTIHEDGTYTIPAAIQKELGITLVEAKQMPLEQASSAYGRVEARPDLMAEVQAPLWGRIEFADKPLTVGDPVKRGQALAQVTLELSALERGLMEAKAVDIKGALQRAKQRKEAAEVEYARAQKLAASNPAYEQDLRWAKELLEEATRGYEEIRKQDEGFPAVIKFRDPRKTPVSSPINGVLASVDFVPGELNTTDQYRKLFTVVDPSRVWLRAEVFLADVWKLKKGQPVRVYPASNARQPVSGAIHWIGDTVNPANRTVPVLVDVPNEGQVFALGSFARLEFQQQRSVLAVPEQAVVDTGTARWVYLASEEQTFAPVAVELGEKRDGWWQVLSGLQQGDRVIAKGAALLSSLPRQESSAASTTFSTSYRSESDGATAQQKPE